MDTSQEIPLGFLSDGEEAAVQALYNQLAIKNIRTDFETSRYIVNYLDVNSGHYGSYSHPFEKVDRNSPEPKLDEAVPEAPKVDASNTNAPPYVTWLDVYDTLFKAETDAFKPLAYYNVQEVQREINKLLCERFGSLPK